MFFVISSITVTTVIIFSWFGILPPVSEIETKLIIMFLFFYSLIMSFRLGQSLWFLGEIEVEKEKEMEAE